jgi:hypothetical protein
MGISGRWAVVGAHHQTAAIFVEVRRKTGRMKKSRKVLWRVR